MKSIHREVKAMECVIKAMYEEREYLEEQLDRHKRDSDKYRLQMVKHFISLYEQC